MRHKGDRHIPDFSPKHKTVTPHEVAPEPKPAKAVPPVRPPAIKPHGTSAKSGRRGQ
jgi:hypothetical protein